MCSTHPAIIGPINQTPQHLHKPNPLSSMCSTHPAIIGPINQTPQHFHKPNPFPQCVVLTQLL